MQANRGGKCHEHYSPPHTYHSQIENPDYKNCNHKGPFRVVSRQLVQSYLESVPSSELGTGLPFQATENFADAVFLISGKRQPQLASQPL